MAVAAACARFTAKVLVVAINNPKVPDCGVVLGTEKIVTARLLVHLSGFEPVERFCVAHHGT